MKCFHFFKDKTKERRHRSSPELGAKEPMDNSGAKRETQSSGSAPSQRTIPELYQEKAHNLRVFTFAELRKATNNFDKLLKLGEGGFGSVYKGAISHPGGGGGADDRVIVAIKKLNRDGWQGHKEWMAEVQFLGVVEHPNLVKLIGYCAINSERGIQRLLVYEYMPNKSLEDHLFSRALPTLPWNTRLHILLGAAQGLAYLHDDVEVQVIYRDFKSSNVLLDNNFHPKLSDFGLAREGPTDGRTHVSTAVVGTYGYAAPEYVETGHLTPASDVYSFGVVLYEVLTGRRSLDKGLPKSEQRLLEWVKHFPPENKRFSMIMDSRLQQQYSLNAAKRIAKLADSCLKGRDQRPKMSEVVAVLKLAIQDSEVTSEGSSSSKHVKKVR